MTESFLKFPLFNLVNEEVVLYPIFVHTLKILWRRLHDLKKDEVKKNSANTTQVSLRSTLYLLQLLWSMDVEIWDFLQSNHLPKTFRKGCWFRNSGLFSLSSLLVMGLVLPKQKKKLQNIFMEYAFQFSQVLAEIGRKRFPILHGRYSGP